MDKKIEYITRLCWIHYKFGLHLRLKALYMRSFLFSHSLNKVLLTRAAIKKGKHLHKIISLLSSPSACLSVFVCENCEEEWAATAIHFELFFGRFICHAFLTFIPSDFQEIFLFYILEYICLYHFTAIDVCAFCEMFSALLSLRLFNCFFKRELARKFFGIIFEGVWELLWFRKMNKIKWFYQMKRMKN